MQVSSQPTLSYNPLTLRKNSPSFGTQEVIKPYSNYVDYGYSTYTSMFRDNDWMKYTKNINKHFKDKEKVNIICQACSDGSEPYTLAIALIETLGSKNANKFLPIRAFDIDDDNIRAAKSGFINLSSNDIKKMESLNIDIDKYFTKTDCELVIKGNTLQDKTETYQVNPILRDAVIFKQESINETLRTLNDDSDTVFLCRNVIPYLGNYDSRETIKEIGKTLKTNSIFDFGDYINSNFGYSKEDRNLIAQCGFKESDDVYIKTCDGLAQDVDTAYMSQCDLFNLYNLYTNL